MTLESGLVIIAIVGGGIGALARHILTVLMARHPSGVAVGVINVLGSLLAGLTIGWLGAESPNALPLLAGALSGFTTFSTFSVETVQLVLDGKYRTAALSVTLSLALGVVAVMAGIALGGLLD